MISKRKTTEEHENHERWLVSYADFITLLFAFFTIMYATSNSDLVKQKKFEGSLKESLKLSGVDTQPMKVSMSRPASKKDVGSPVAENIANNQLAQHTDLDDFVDRFFATKDPRIQELKSKVTILSDQQGVFIEIKKKELDEASNPLAIPVLGLLMQKADSQIHIVAKLQESSDFEYIKDVFKVREKLLEKSNLSGPQLTIKFESKGIDSESIRFAIIR
jgi:flagellar motor protein MotB